MNGQKQDESLRKPRNLSINSIQWIAIAAAQKVAEKHCGV